VYDGDNNIADYLAGILRGGIDFGAVLGTKGVMRLGGVWTKIDARVDTGDPVLPSVRELTAGPRLQITIDQLDHAFFARNGYSAIINAYLATKSFGSALDYQRVSGLGNFAKSWGPHTLNLHVEGGSALGTDMPAYESFLLGGPLRLSGFRIGQFAGREFAFGRLMYYNRILPMPDLLGSGIYAGASAEVGRMYDRFGGLPLPGTLYSGSVFIGADTFAGPFYLGVGVGNGGSVSAYLLLGAP
jgi:NTE family protein